MRRHDPDDTAALRSLAPPVRNNYFYGKLLDEQSFRLEQRYGNGKRWLMNRLGLGSGPVCGLRLEINGEGQLYLTPGVAIDALGREIVVGERVPVDPRRQTDDLGRPGDALQAGPVTIGLAYRLCPTDPVPVLVDDCGGAEESAPGTLRESFAVVVRKGAPRAADPAGPGPNLFATGPAGAPDPAALLDGLTGWLSRDCPSPAAPDWVVLGQVALTEGVERLAPADVTAAGRGAVPSTPELLQLILWLWQRVEEQFAALAPPPPNPDPPPPVDPPDPLPDLPPGPFQVSGVQLLDVQGQTVGQIAAPSGSVALPRGVMAAVRVALSRPARPDSLVPATSVGDASRATIALAPRDRPEAVLALTLAPVPGQPTSFDLRLDPATAQGIPRGVLRLALSGAAGSPSRPVIRTADNQPLGSTGTVDVGADFLGFIEIQ